MNYFQAYLPSLDEAIVAAWDSQVAEAGETPWLSGILATQSADLFPRFSACYAQLRALPRVARRALQRQLARSVELREVFPGALQQKLARSLAGAALLLALGQGTAQAATLTVVTTRPGILPDGDCSLIEAIINANNDLTTHTDCPPDAVPFGADTIQLPANKTITLTSSFNTYFLSPTGLPLITGTLTIEGNGAKIVRRGTGPKFRLMAVSGTGDLTVRNLTLKGGRTDGVGGAICGYVNTKLTIEGSTISGNSVSGVGGAIFNDDYGTLTITNSTISGNRAYAGGGLFNDYRGTATITNSIFSKNYARDDGGGALNGYRSTMTITNSTISSNTAKLDAGGGIFTDDLSPLTIESSTISGNKADSGGGVFSDDYGIVTIRNSTISGNKATYGAGILNDYFATMTIENSTISSNKSPYLGGGFFNSADSTLTINNSTISGNKAMYAGGIFNDGFINPTTRLGTVIVNNSTIASNRARTGAGIGNEGILDLNRSLISGNKGPNGREVNHYVGYGGTVTASNYNIFGVSNNAGTFGFTPAAPDIVPTVTLGRIIGPLADNGGPTKTRALAETSPAIDIIPTGDPACTGTDQRGTGFPRPIGAGCDIGAFEKQP